MFRLYGRDINTILAISIFVLFQIRKLEVKPHTNSEQYTTFLLQTNPIDISALSLSPLASLYHHLVDLAKANV